MKQKSFILYTLLAALPLSLGVTPAWADDDDAETTGTTITISDFSQGTATRSDDTNPTPETTSNAAFIKWVSTSTPAVTIQDANSTTNNIEFSSNGDDTYALKLSEGSSTSFGYTISVAEGYYISDMTIKGIISATDLKVTIDYDNELTVEEANGEVEKSITGINKPQIRIHLDGDNTGETFTITSLTVTIAEGIPDPVDLTNYHVSAVSSEVASGIEEGKWYMLTSGGGKASSYVAYEDEGYISLNSETTLSTHVYANQSAEDAAQYLLRFISSSKTSDGSEGKDTPVYHIQFATGNYWNDMKDNTSTSDNTGDITVSTTSIGEYNAYLVSDQSYFGINVYDLSYAINVADKNDDEELPYRLKQYSNTGYVTNDHANDHWNLYEVTLANPSEDITWKMTTAGWGTMILPFAADVPEDLAAYTVSSIAKNDTLSLGDAVESLEACTPYIVQYTGEEELTEDKEYTFTGSPEDDLEDTYTANADDGTSLTGTLKDMDMPVSDEENSYYLLQEQDDDVAFYIVQDLSDDDGNAITLSLNAYHCYLSTPVEENTEESEGNVKLVINLPGTAKEQGTATAITSVEQETASSTAVYDLSGRQVTEPRKGIYIKGGKKVIIK